MTFQLAIKSGPDQGLTVTLENGKPFLIGRGQDANPRLSDPSVSRKHLQIEARDGAVKITDLGSSSGTFVNGEKIQESQLKVGDQFQMGDTIFQLKQAVESAQTIVRDPQNLKGKSADDWADLVGKTIHVYEIKSQKAQGATGAVFEAWDQKNSRDVALKVLPAETTQNEEEMQRFTRAMKTMFPVRHPNIIRIYNAGTWEGRPWVALEYFESEPLTKTIERIGTAGMLDWRTGFMVALQIGRALEAAYEHHIIHRNISPQNILYNREQQLTKLGDLMLAKALEGAKAQQITKAGELVGDVSYMSPERLMGQDELVDCRADIYSLGATVYALLTGRPPFEARSLPELVMKVRNEDPEKPKKYQLSIADMFEGVVLRMLSKRPEDRFQTPTALVQDLERVGKFQGLAT